MFSILITFVAAALLVPGIVLMILGIIAGGKKRVAAITVAFLVHLSVLFVTGKIYYDYNHIIGTFSGIEYDMITIDGETYKADYDHTYSSSDTNKLLGKVVFSGHSPDTAVDPMYVYSIDGTDDYIYAIWDYNGQIFKKR